MAKIQLKGTAGMVFTIVFLGFLIGIMVLAWKFVSKFGDDVSRKIDEGQRDIRVRIEGAFGVRIPEKTREIAVSEDAAGVWAKVAVAKEGSGWVAGELERAGFVPMGEAEMTLGKGEAPKWWKAEGLADRKQLGKEQPVERTGPEIGGAVRAWWGTAGDSVVLYLRNAK